MRQKSQEKKQSILVAASKLFLSNGVDNVSMSDISDTANCSKATLYQYYTSKEQLFFDAAQFLIESRDMHLLEILKETASPLRQSLISFATSYISMICSRESIAIYRMLISESNKNNIGVLFYKNGRLREYEALESYLSSRTNDTHINVKRAAKHFFALIESDFLEECALGLLSDLNVNEISLSVTDSVDVFLKAYPFS